VTTADEITGTENKTKRNWFGNVCAEATNEKNKAYSEIIKKR
jgi:hypothetical protein